MKTFSYYLTLISLISSVKSACEVIPEICPNNNIKFWLYTRANPENPYLVNISDPLSTDNAPFIKDKKLFFIIHGLNASKDNIPNIELRPELFKRDNYNVISLEYIEVSMIPCVMEAVWNVKVIANCSAQFIDTLVEKNITTLPNVHIIGFSLGAHIGGYMSQFIKSGQLERITGLDPISLMFRTNLWSRYLSKNDAKFVDIIYTTLLNYELLPKGHANFMANQVIHQPGCPWLSLFTLQCQHFRAVFYYVESINSPKGFYTTNCPYSWMCWFAKKKIVKLGIDTPIDTRGTFYFSTNDKPPYAKGQIY